MQNDITLRKNKLYEGKVVEVLIEGNTRKRPDRLSGRTRGNKLVAFEGEEKSPGTLVNVRIEKAFTWGLVGKQIK